MANKPMTVHVHNALLPKAFSITAASQGSDMPNNSAHLGPHGDPMGKLIQRDSTSPKDILGLGSVRREHTDSKTLLIVRAGLH